ncbi:MAG: DUF5063 domain-containing protein [Bacteroides sp.]|nr:DUF5063 domain-containing protein [Roseburia sp.]MCM1347155.1 DUF5063 domain-containing protein [Bacteroides sp.]MCM1421006.1 DUF5063 domain-containing protein [Bacteroides sp.]
MEKELKSPVYSHDVLEFVTVAVQFCVYLESSENKTRKEFVDTMLKLLPLLYLKGSLLPRFVANEDEEPETFVTEDNYEMIRMGISRIMGEHDDYLDVFVEDMKYSDTPILMTISENLADIYQDLKNFAFTYKLGVEERMMDALAFCKDNFETYWGQRVVNVMRALHDVMYNHKREDLEDGENGYDYNQREI